MPEVWQVRELLLGGIALDVCSFFFFNDTATTEIYTLSLHDALPISAPGRPRRSPGTARPAPGRSPAPFPRTTDPAPVSATAAGSRRPPAAGPGGHTRCSHIDPR